MKTVVDLANRYNLVICDPLSQEEAMKDEVPGWRVRVTTGRISDEDLKNQGDDACTKAIEILVRDLVHCVDRLCAGVSVSYKRITTVTAVHHDGWLWAYLMLG